MAQAKSIGSIVAAIMLLLCLAGAGRAATIAGSLIDSGEDVVSPTVRFVPLSTPQALGTNTVLDVVRTVKATNGLWSVWLVGGRYRTEFGPFGKSIGILVPPDDTNVYAFNYVASLATNLGTFSWTNAHGISQFLFAGNNITLTVTNAGQANEGLRIAATGGGPGGSGINVAAGTVYNLNLSTNGGGDLVTFSEAFAPQPASGNLTNWGALATSAKQDALGYVPQIGSANLNNWSLMDTGSVATIAQAAAQNATNGLPFVKTNGGTLYSGTLSGNTTVGALFIGGGDIQASNGVSAGEVVWMLYDRTHGTFSYWSNGVWSGLFSGGGPLLTNLNGTEIRSGTVAAARLGSGSGGATKFLREDSTWQTLAAGGDLLSANNLSDVANTGTARTNLLAHDASNLTIGTVAAPRVADLAESQITSLVGDLSGKVGTNETRAVVITNAANKLGGDVSLVTGLTAGQIPAIAESGVTSLVADLSAKTGTNETRAVTITNAANKLGGDVSLVTGLTAGQIPAIAESGVTSLVADLSAKTGTNETRAVTITNAANKLGGDVSLVTGLTAGQIPAIAESGVTSLVADLSAKTGTNETRAVVVTNAANTIVGTLGGGGAGVSNVWVKQKFRGYISQAVVSQGVTRYIAIDTPGTAQSVQANATTLSPVGGYLTNFEVWSQVAWPSTTNIVWTVQTNKALTAPVDTPITCTLAPAGGTVYTNSGTTSVTLPASQDINNGYTWLLKFVATSPSGNLAAQSISWSVEWWHQ